MWFIRDPERLNSEAKSIETLRGDKPWLGVTANRIIKGAKFAVDFDLVVNSETLPFTLVYPSLFPATPPSVIPRDGRHYSGHQYGEGGELCLEFRSDNWDPSVTGAMMIESAYRLLSGEQPSAEERAVVPSVHRETLGQRLRSSSCRFLVSRELKEFIAALPADTAYECTVVDILCPGADRIWAAYVASIGPATAPNWREGSIPARSDKGERSLLIRVAAPADAKIANQEALDRLIGAIAPRSGVHVNGGEQTGFTVVADGLHANLYYSYQQNDARCVIPFVAIDLSDDAVRLPDTYSSLASKRVGVVGAGSLGSKIAASLARSGVGSFVLVDDDILTPGNLIRHELDAGCLGAHKVNGLEARLRALAPGVRVSVSRVILGGQESSATTAFTLDELATCDLLIDATADPQAFNLVAAVARRSNRPMIWAEVYAGGIGGFVCRLRPGIEPPPHAARRQYYGWCHDRGVPWHGDGEHYDANRENAPPLVADDAEVAVIAAHASRMALDTLIRADATAFPHPAYVIGLSREWIFSAPFETYPISFLPEGEWSTPLSTEQTDAAVEFLCSLLDRGTDADRSGS